MHLTQHTDYALRVLMYIASNSDRIVNIADIATYYDLPKSYLMKVITALVKSGYLLSIRGKNGGLQLNQQPEQINIGAVVRDMEPFKLVECMRENNQCNIAPNCRLQGVLSRASQAFLAYLDHVTLDDLVGEDLAAMLYQPQS